MLLGCCLNSARALFRYCFGAGLVLVYCWFGAAWALLWRVLCWRCFGAVSALLGYCLNCAMGAG
eukprot:9409461-Lingulodinium_polyedra.AAC.1